MFPWKYILKRVGISLIFNQIKVQQYFLNQSFLLTIQLVKVRKKKYTTDST